jgi:hypothetical protein
MVMIKNPGNYYPPIQYPGMPTIPGYFPGGRPPFPPQYMNQWGSFPTWNKNYPDANVGQDGALWWKHDIKGYGLSLDGDGQYTPGRDGVLGFDSNNDGKLSKEEIEKTNKQMKAFGGNFDLDGDGKVGFFERLQGKAMQKQMQRYDKNHDGRLDANELQALNAKVGIDQNGDGKFGSNETYSTNNFPTMFGRGSIGSVDPNSNWTQVNNRMPMPWYQPYQPYQPPYYQPQPVGFAPDNYTINYGYQQQQAV